MYFFVRQYFLQIIFCGSKTHNRMTLSLIAETAHQYSPIAWYYDIIQIIIIIFISARSIESSFGRFQKCHAHMTSFVQALKHGLITPYNMISCYYCDQ